MASAELNQMTIWEQKYYDIMELYALNDELLATVEQAADPEAQLALIAPLIETIGASTDILTEEYVALCDGNIKSPKSAKLKIEGALRKIYGAVHEFKSRAKDARNAAHVVVKRLKRQLEQVIANFVEFMTLSLDRIMQKNDIDELNEHHASIALMLHSVGRGPQGA